MFDNDNWANELVASGAVKSGIGADGFATNDTKNLHYLHEVLYYAATSSISLSRGDLFRYTKTLQRAVGFNESDLSKDSALGSHLRSMKNCVSISTPFRQLLNDQETEWVGMFGDTIRGENLLQKVDVEHLLRDDLVERYRNRKSQRGEILSTVPASPQPPPASPPPPAKADAQTVQELEDAYALAKRRRHQALFREMMLGVHGGKCCLTGVTDRTLLVAAHIDRWADSPESRLDPANGLLLYCEYDQYFEHGYFIFGEDRKVALTPRGLRSDGYVRNRLNAIIGKLAPDSVEDRFLLIHRTRVLASFGEV